MLAPHRQYPGLLLTLNSGPETQPWRPALPAAALHAQPALCSPAWASLSHHRQKRPKRLRSQLRLRFCTTALAHLQHYSRGPPSAPQPWPTLAPSLTQLCRPRGPALPLPFGPKAQNAASAAQASPNPLCCNPQDTPTSRPKPDRAPPFSGGQALFQLRDGLQRQSVQLPTVFTCLD